MNSGESLTWKKKSDLILNTHCPLIFFVDNEERKYKKFRTELRLGAENEIQNINL